MLTQSAKKNGDIKFRLTTRPDVAQINDALSHVTERTGSRFRFVWQAKDGVSDMGLTVFGSLKLGLPTWQLHSSQNGLVKTIWAHATTDVLLVYNLIASACGDAADTVDGDGLIAATAAFREVSKNNDLYFLPNKTQEVDESLFGLRELFAKAKLEAEAAASLSDDSNAGSNGAGSGSPRVAKGEIDKAAIDDLRNSLQDCETGLYKRSAMLFFLEQEYFRSYRVSAPLSILFIKLQSIPGPGHARLALTNAQTADIVRSINKMKRHADSVGHYEKDVIAILLPNTDAKGVEQFARKVVQIVHDVNSTIEKKRLSISVGLSSIPEDSTDLETFLSIAETALVNAANRCCTIVGHTDLRPVSTIMPGRS